MWARFTVAAWCGLAVAAPGPHTEPVDLARYARVHCVAASGSDARGDGSRARPWATVAHALAQSAGAGPERRQAVLVAAGRWSGATLMLRPHVDLYGGFEAGGWTRDVAANQSVLSGDGARRVLAGADHARLDGFTVRDGRVRGPGGGLLCDGVSPHVSNNIFIANRTEAPENWKPPQIHETVNDGGALAAVRGAAPRVERNLFAANRTAAGRGGALACDRSSPVILENVFVENESGAEDPGRSSDGGGISAYDRSHPEIRGNVIAGNRASAANDGGGIFVALWSQPVIAGNVVAGNVATDDAGGIFIGGQKHHYGTPLDAIPPPEEYTVRLTGNVVAGNRNEPALNSGAARITMQSRAVVEGNLFAANPGGVYLQTSQATLLRNTLLDDFLFINDSKASRTLPGPSRIEASVLAGKVDLKEKAVLVNNRVARQPPAPGPSGTASRLERDPRTFTTAFDGAGGAELAGRPIRVGERWTVVRDAAGGRIRVWGLLPGTSAPAEFEILPDYRPYGKQENR